MLNILRGLARMGNMRFQFGDRRWKDAIPKFPFKDSNGVKVKECRRKIPGRRMIMLKGEWIDELVMGLGHHSG